MGAEEEPDEREKLGEGLRVVVRLPGLTPVGPPQLPPPRSRSKLLLIFMMFLLLYQILNKILNAIYVQKL